MQVGGEFDARVPDPDEPEHDLPGPGGEPVACRGRVDVLAYGDDERCWLVHHRLADDGWVEVDDLLIDDGAVTARWASERCFLDVELSGTIRNEVRTHPCPPRPAPAGASRWWRPAGGGWCASTATGSSSGARSSPATAPRSTGWVAAAG